MDRERDDKGRLRASAAVLEPRLISPITPYSAATHDPPTSRHLLHRCRSPLVSGPTSRSRATTHPPPVLLGATLERLTRSNPRHSRLFPPVCMCECVCVCARAVALLPFLDTLSPLSIAYIPLRWTKCVSSVVVYTASTTVFLLPLLPPRPPPSFTPSTRSRSFLLVLLVPRTSSMVHSR